MYYLNVDFYRYYIGREDQSVNERIMIKRIDQQIKVNKLMIELVDITKVENVKRRKYMFNYLEIITAVSSILLIKSGSEENLIKKKALWDYIKRRDFKLYLKMRIGFLGITTNLAGRIGRMISIGIYKVSTKVVGFN